MRGKNVEERGGEKPWVRELIDRKNVTLSGGYSL